MRNSFFHFSVTFLSFMMVPSSLLLATKAPLGEELGLDQPSANRSRIIERRDISSCPINTLNDDIYRHIFSFLNQRDVPSVTRTSKRWKRLMEDNSLWRGYAQRAHLVMLGETSHNKNYKALVREHSIPSFIDLSVSKERMHIEAKSLSFDGSVIVGQSKDGAAGNQSRAFRWTVEKGMESLGTLNGGENSFAEGVSNDGFVIVGSADDGAVQNQRRAFRWTIEKGIESLGTLNGGNESFASGVSRDGSVIVGQSKDGAAGNQSRAFRWTAEKGIESVEKLLADKGALPPGWALTNAYAVTPSGTVLIGSGIYKVQRGNGESKTLIRAWRAVIPRSNLF